MRPALPAADSTAVYAAVCIAAVLAVPWQPGPAPHPAPAIAVAAATPSSTGPAADLMTLAFPPNAHSQDLALLPARP
ncbi:MAG: hypothetical protein RLY78_83 [Pseudomonadota bacterium]|jgi:hypothetical protein